jgi:hypothetical protein
MRRQYAFGYFKQRFSLLHPLARLDSLAPLPLSNALSLLILALFALHFAMRRLVLGQFLGRSLLRCICLRLFPPRVLFRLLRLKPLLL